MTAQRTEDVDQLTRLLQQSDGMITRLRAQLAELTADSVPEDLHASTRELLAECIDTRGRIELKLSEYS